MKKKVSITIDSELLKQIEDIAKKRGINRSKYIEEVVQKQMRAIPVVILATDARIKGKDKSLLEYNDKKLIDRHIPYIKNQGFNDIHVITDSKKLKSYLENNYPEVSVMFEEVKLGNGGSLRKCSETFLRRFIFLYCDIELDIRLKKVLNFHLKNKSGVTLVLKSMKEPSKYGVAVLEGSRIERFEEKPELAASHLVYIGVGVIDPRSGTEIKDGKFELQLNDIEGKFGYIYEGNWKSFDTEKDFK